MGEVVRVPAKVSGLPDAVELMAQCSVARYRVKSDMVIGVKGIPRLHPCKIMASYSNGTLSVSVPETAFMVTVRLNEAMAVLKEAADYSRAAKENPQEGRANGQERTAQEG